ncbi:DUF4135 domain-containing protein [Bacillus cereus]|uniref:DUF4135 domain-containing protein n=1 Tax=Bacillus cereus TaxID=1396 RepID=UPI000BF9ADF8|nr:DUF4135 domain-containing protein [Bacillus cereus]PFA66967.1 hypothetical protein CN403_24045 [Bacillus cereus]
MFNRIMTHKNEIFNLIQSEKNLKGRLLLRATQTYADILSLASHPRFLMNKLDREMIIACAVYDEEKDYAVLKEEYSSLLEGRTPLFISDLNKEIVTVTKEQYNYQKTLLDYLI